LDSIGTAEGGVSVGSSSKIRLQSPISIGESQKLSPTGLRPEKDFAGEAQQELKTTDPTSRQRGRPTSTNP
jgi:hypothetical protein